MNSSIYLFGARSVFLYKLVFLVLAVVGAFLVRTDAELGAPADFGTGGMFLANMIIVLTCGFLAIRALRDYFARLNRGEMRPHAAPRMHDVVDGSDMERGRKE